MPTDWQIFWANAGCADPEKIFISRLNGVMAWLRGVVILPPKKVFARGPHQEAFETRKRVRDFVVIQIG
jgi:hypothetical protein